MPNIPTARLAKRHPVAWRLRKAVFAAACALAAANLQAVEPGEPSSSAPRFSIRGFGTVGAAHSSIDRADFVGNTRQRRGAGFSDDWAFGVDSKLGVQFDAKLTERLTGVLQVVSQQLPNGKYTPQVEWANLKYQLRSDLSVRIGRILLAPFLVADSRLIGYGYPWIRPPIETYNLAQITKSDGINMSWRARLGSATNTIQASYGQQDEDFVFAAPSIVIIVSPQVRQLVGITDTVESGPWLGRATFFTGNISLGNSEGRVKFYSLGAAYDSGSWFIQGEWSLLDSAMRLQGATTQRRIGFYLSAGYRWREFTPYFTYSETAPEGSQTAPNVLTVDQKTYSAGMRWDLARNTAAKLQFDRIKLGTQRGNIGYFTNVQRGFPFAGSGNVASVAVDFVF